MPKPEGHPPAQSVSGPDAAPRRTAHLPASGSCWIGQRIVVDQHTAGAWPAQIVSVDLCGVVEAVELLDGEEELPEAEAQPDIVKFIRARIGESRWAVWGGEHPPADLDVESRRRADDADARLRILDDHRPNRRGDCYRCPGDGWPCTVVQELALVYHDHPDFVDEWRA